MRKIIHIDMDAFYASVEQRDHPEWRDKPLAVGGDEERGVVSAASYEARTFGVRSAMNGKRAKELCPELIFAPLRFHAYKEASQQIHQIFLRYTDAIEPLSLDEAYLDVTTNHFQTDSATFIAQSIKTEIFNETGLTASAGISFNKFLAKMASDEDKPNGLFIIEPKEAQSYLYQLPIGRFYGVGNATEQKLKELGIYKGRDLLLFSERELIHYFGKTGLFLHHVVRGEDERPVVSNRERKSIGVETTFSTNILDEMQLWEAAKKLLKDLEIRINKAEAFGRTLSFKIRFADFSTFTRSKTTRFELSNINDLLDLGVQLFSHFSPLSAGVRLIGFSVSGFDREEDVETQLQLTLE